MSDREKSPAERMAAAVSRKKKKVTHAACPCGEIPTDLMIRVPQGSKHGTVAGNCCGDWTLEFKAGYPKDNKDLSRIATEAWENAPRGHGA